MAMPTRDCTAAGSRAVPRTTARQRSGDTLTRPPDGQGSVAGRPRTGRDPVVALRLPKDVIKDLDEFSKEQHIDQRSVALRRLIEEALAKRKAP